MSSQPCTKPVKAAGKLTALTGIRAYAALWVVAFHLYAADQLSGVPLGFWEPFLQAGPLGVDLFFVLSGFIIAYVHQAEFLKGHGTLFRFYGLRIARMMPVHYAMLLLYLLAFTIGAGLLHRPPSNPEYFQPLDFVYHLLNLQGWGVSNSLSWNLPAWSVSAEGFAYLFFPFLIPLIAKVQKPPAQILGIVLSIFALNLAHVLLPNALWTYDTGLIRVTFEFVAGCFTFNLFKSTSIRGTTANLLSALTAVLLMFAIGFLGQSSDLWPQAMWWIPNFFPALIFFLAKAQGGFARLFSNRLACFLGEISFSIYMVHSFMLMLSERLLIRLPLFAALPVGGWVAVEIIVILLSAYLLYRFVEVPMRNFLRKRLDAWTVQASLRAQSALA